MQLRDYQQAALDGARAQFRAGKRSVLLVLPTGCGKTVIFAEAVRLAAAKGGKALVLAHRTELLEQARAKLRGVAPDLRVDLEQAAARASTRADVVVASVQSLRGPRLERWADDAFSLVIVDEAHHATAKSYRTILEHFAAARVLGVTATPDRADEAKLGDVFDAVGFDYGMQRAIADGYLVPLKLRSVVVEALDMRHVKSRGGDFVESELVAALEGDEVLLEIAGPLPELAQARPTIVFIAGVTNAHRLAALLNERTGRPGCAVALDGTTDPAIRAHTLALFARGDFQFLINVGLFTEGFDSPRVSCVAVARPTQSRGLYCFDGATEALTPHGWVPGSTLTVGDRVAAFEPATQVVRWETIEAHVHRPLYPDELMLSISTPTVDLRVTDTHRMVFRSKIGRAKTRTPWTIAAAGDLYARSLDFELPAAGNESAPGIPLTDAEIAFIGWVQTDGYVNKTTGAVQISQQRPEQCEHIETTLAACGFKWRVAEDSSPTPFGPRHETLRIYRVSRGKPRGTDKHLRGWGALAPWLPKADPAAWDRLEAMDARQWGVFLDAWHRGDGSKQAGQSWTRRSYHLAIADATVAGWVQSMCMRRGWRANVARSGTVWMVHCRERDFRAVKGASVVPSATRPGEHVWCVQVPSGALLVRRGGKGVIAGNCQMIGRGTRPLTGTIDACSDGSTRVAAIASSTKPDLLVIDFTTSSSQHRLVTPVDVLGVTDPHVRDIAADLLEQDPELDVSEAIERAMADARITLVKRLAHEYELLFEEWDPFRIEIAVDEGRELDLRALDGAIGVDIDALREELLELGVGKERVKTLSVGQAVVLHRGLLDRKRRGLCSLKQARQLQRFDLNPNVSARDASYAMSVLHRAGWRFVPPALRKDPRFALREHSAA